MSDESDLEALWGMLLSRDAQRIRAAWATLAPAEQAAVHNHLRTMVTGSGWLDGQRESARVALDAIGADGDSPPMAR